MSTSLYIDSETKERAVEKAKKDRLSFSAVVRILLSEYANGKITIGANINETYTAKSISVDRKTQAKMNNILSTWQKQKK